MITRENISLLFEFYLREVTYRKDFDYLPNPNSIQLIDNFLVRIRLKNANIILGADWYFKFFCFQFNRWKEIGSPRAIVGPHLSWIIGNKAIEKWEGKHKEYWYFVENNFLKYYKGINYNKVEQILNKDKKVKNDYLSLNHYEEFEKEKYLNKINGFGICLTMRTLFNSRSKNCQKCIYQLSCKDTLKVMFPIIYNLRQEEINKYEENKIETSF